MQSSCIILKKAAYLSRSPPRYLPGSTATETPAALDVAKLRQVAAAVTTRAAGSTQSKAGTYRVCILSGRKCGSDERSELVHAANQLPADTAYLY